ncbi:hypothetical protein C3495_13140 [Clostridiaceae bacterium 14S0207]|nr:hypothetical protein C3495_13140 [Clostridiaceae bacterium 14S0207]
MDKNKERIAITKFLQWNDRNGSYTDENCDLEEIPRMTYEDAVKYFFGVMNDDFYYKITDNIFEITYVEAIKYAKEKGFYDITIQKLNSLVSEDNPTVELYRSLI